MAHRVSARCACLRCRAAEMGAPSDRDALTAFPFAAGMASLAGATDAYGLGFLHDLFVSFMGGNTTSEMSKTWGATLRAGLVGGQSVRPAARL